MAGKFFSGLLDLLFPPKCAFCGKLLWSSEKGLCESCRETLPYLKGADRSQNGDFFETCVSVFPYRDTVRESIRRMKFGNKPGYLSCYARLLAPVIREELDGRFDLISWVPLSKQREKKRGYDQAMLLAMAVAVELEDVAVETLEKIRDAQAQSTMGGKDARQANILGAYQVKDPELVNGMHVLLIDDVVTTGSTLSECSRMLRMAGAESVVCATLARAGEN